MGLIDKSAVVAELEKIVKEAEIILRDVPSSAIFGLTQAYKNVLSFLDTLETKELPSIPSNIDEAAKDYARCYTESDNGNGGDDWEDDISIAFTAGAQWLAEKGATMSIDDNTEWAAVDTFVHRNVDNKTVIQIRKI